MTHPPYSLRDSPNPFVSGADLPENLLMLRDKVGLLRSGAQGGGGVSWSGTGWGSRSLEMGGGSLVTLKMLFLDGFAAQKCTYFQDFNAS